VAELFANNAASTLASSILAGDLSLTVATGEGALFPSPSGGDYFHATLDDGVNIEIVRVTARSSDTLTIVRAQQGTAAAAFGAGTAVQIRITANTLTRFEESAGPALIEYVTTPGVSDYYQASSGNGDGSADFVVAVWQRDIGPALISSGSRYHIASGGKWEFAWNYGVLSYVFIDGTSANTINLGSTAAFANNVFYVVERDTLLMLRVTGGAGTATIRGYANGVELFSQAAANSGVGAGTDGLKLGGQGGFGAAFRGGIQGAAYLDGTVTDAQIQDFTEACLQARGIVAGGIAWTSRYDHSTVPGATWVDQEGVADLTRNGSPGSISRQMRIA